MALLDSDEPREKPIQAMLDPHLHVGSVSEAFEQSLSAVSKDEKLRAIAIFNYFKSIVHPGELVGVIAAQAIGEPATQMTLNTFHLAGYGGTNVTLGIPRLREILVVATDKPLTPTMTIPLMTDSTAEAELFVEQFARVSLRDCVSQYRVAEDFFSRSELRRDRQIVVEIWLIREQMEKYGLDKPLGIAFLRSSVARNLKKRISAVFKSTGTKIHEVDDKVAEPTSSNQKLEELGADLSKKHDRKSEKASYEDDDDNGRVDLSKADNEAITDENIAVDFDQDALKIIVTYVVSNVSVKILLESIVEAVLDEIMVHQVPDVTRATISQKKTKEGNCVVVTEGANLPAILQRDDIDLDHFYTNNIAEILRTYGIEAARAAIIIEVTAVFDAYGIGIDKRHLMLIADYVTNTGEWIGMSRHSMKSCASPLQQMSFETTTQFLTNATLHGFADQMQSPSASLSAGNVVRAGSGMCDILVPFE
jgi:DNA-directed RNA polymerase I subunit RPA1